jgi:2,4-dienoyl-CoA reductase (NADPH2)
MGSMHTGLEESSRGFHKLAAFYAERAAGGVGLIVTGGIAPNFAGRVEPRALQLSYSWQVKNHRIVTGAVHAAGGRIAMQILHAGRYAYHPLSVAPGFLGYLLLERCHSLPDRRQVFSESDHRRALPAI